MSNTFLLYTLTMPHLSSRSRDLAKAEQPPGWNSSSCLQVLMIDVLEDNHIAI